MISQFEYKTRENKARRAAKRQGLEIERCRHRDTRAIGYGRYRVSQPEFNTVIAGSSQAAYEMTLDEVERFLNLPPDKQGRLPKGS